MNRRDREYLEAWENLDDETRRQMAAAGIKGPDLENTSVYHPEYSVEIAVEPEEPFAGIEDDEQICEVVRRLVGELLGQSNPALAIECFSLVTGIGYLGNSMTEIAKRHGITRAAVSKRCVELCDALGLEPSRAMRRRKSQDDVDAGHKPESVHPHLNRIVTVFARMRRSGWLHRQDHHQLSRLRADLEPIRAICDELDAMRKESI